MLGWALKKGFQGATGLRDAPEGGEDTTQLEAPDTPAPIFAARAIKNALWGQSATIDGPSAAQAKPTEAGRAEPSANAIKTTDAIPTDTRSPTKLNSILLTPGTGASRRKRVSFGRDTKAGNNIDSSPLAASSTRNGRQRKKTTLQQALENSRPTKSKAPVPQVEKIQEDDSEEDEGDWEWEDDVCCNHDVTVDLNEPHSESGKYWKAEWARYREEAKSDIEQLVKYKANAKSFAAKKDTEASQLSQKLKEEQAKVTEMEGKIADMAAKLASSEKHGTDKDRASLTKDLARQNTLIAEYRDRVKDLETRLKEAPSQSNSIRSSHQRIDTSPRTEQNLLEVSRELRKARSELRQLDRLRDEVKRLKSNLATSRERVATLEAQASAGEFAESSRIRNLEKELHEAKEESQQKDIEIRKLKKDYEALKRDAKSRTAEAMQVLQGKNAKIEELEKKLEDLRAANASSPRKNLDAAIAEHNWITQDLKSGIEALSKPSKYEKAGLINQHARAASVEDMTLDMTQRSLLRDKDDYILDAFRQNKPYDDGILTDWTADIPVLDLQVKEERRQHQEAEKLNREPILEGTDASPSRRVARHANQRLLAGNHRVISNVLSNRVNGSSGKLSHKHQHPNTNIALSTENDQSNMGRRIASPRTAPLAENKATMSGALDRPTRQPRILSKTACALSSGDDTPAIDLVQDQYSRLGGPSTDRSVLGNTSRCTLPPDRLAAARARLEQKKMERRKAGGQDLDKENVRP